LGKDSFQSATNATMRPPGGRGMPETGLRKSLGSGFGEPRLLYAGGARNRPKKTAGYHGRRTSHGAMMRRVRGFTLVEIAVVLVIVSLITVGILALFTNTLRATKSRVAAENA